MDYSVLKSETLNQVLVMDPNITIVLLMLPGGLGGVAVRVLASNL